MFEQSRNLCYIFATQFTRWFFFVIKTIIVKQSELKNGIESSKCFFKGSIIDVRNEMPLEIVKIDFGIIYVWVQNGDIKDFGTRPCI